MVIWKRPRYSASEQRAEFKGISLAVDNVFKKETFKQATESQEKPLEKPSFLAERRPGRRDRKSKFIFD
jgi:hypothetical protein